jgi:hypothetical protein
MGWAARHAAHTGESERRGSTTDVQSAGGVPEFDVKDCLPGAVSRLQKTPMESYSSPGSTWPQSRGTDSLQATADDPDLYTNFVRTTLYSD